MHEQAGIAAQFIAQLADRLKKRQAFNIANRSADFDQNEIMIFNVSRDERLNFIGHMGNNLDGGTQIIAMALAGPGIPRFIRDGLLTLSGVASNFAGVPLAFAFLATIGRLGLVTILLRDLLGIDIYAAGFTVLGTTGLTLTYLYFQLPLMVLLIMPAVEGLKKEWIEASAMLGATPWQHAWRITAPILFPSFAGAALLLFANGFGAVATAFALTGSFINLVTILLFAEIRGEVLHDPNLGYALAFGMVAITAVCNIVYLRLRAFSARRFR